MLTPIPLATTIETGSTSQPFLMPTVENLIGQAITLHVKHKNKHDPEL